jgi:hypothetical protein
MVFDSVEKHMTTVSQYAIKERVQIRNKRNKKRGLRVIVRRGYIFLKRRAAPATASIGAYIISLKRWVCVHGNILL